MLREMLSQRKEAAPDKVWNVPENDIPLLGSSLFYLMVSDRQKQLDETSLGGKISSHVVFNKPRT